MALITFKHVDIIFGDNTLKSLELLDRGEGREAIREQTGDVVGVSDACIEVEKGEICVLMGLSGSGKSTLLRAVNGLNKIARGEILIGEGEEQIDVANCDANTLRDLRMNRISMVFQQAALMPWLTVEENVAFGLEMRGVSKAERKAVIADKLKLVGLYEWKDCYPDELSGGMQQRVGLARAFATDGEILLMDEPFSALDPLIRQQLQDELIVLQEKLNKTIIFVSHDLDEALKLGSRIAIMESGQVVQYGPPEDIVLNPADDYVERFTAHINPLNVLRGRSLMTPRANLKQEQGALILDAEAHYRLELDQQERIERLCYNGEEKRVLIWEEGQELAQLPPDVVLAVDVEIGMRRAMELRDRTGYSLLLQDRGQFMGVLGDAEFYSGLLNQGRNQSVQQSPANPAVPTEEPRVRIVR